MSFFRRRKYIPIGQMVHQYEVLDYMGEGRYGICYMVSFQGKKYIYKDLKSHERKKSGKKIYFEAEILQQLDEPNVPAVLAIHEEKNHYGILMTYIEGETVEEWLFKNNRMFTSQERESIFLQLLDLVESLHMKGIVHRDIRPSNVIYSEEKVYLVDFGLARWINHEKYVPQTDFAYLGHFLLYLYYSTFPVEQLKRKPWYDELPITDMERIFLKKLLDMDKPFTQVGEIRRMFLQLNASNAIQ